MTYDEAIEKVRRHVTLRKAVEENDAKFRELVAAYNQAEAALRKQCIALDAHWQETFSGLADAHRIVAEAQVRATETENEDEHE